ncbi:hypothetical protein [Anaeromassilibacillus senegalensis]|uniref:hypothetical protein n=1 Tax=Anaeromassilibacillus senegalensis TaxID=1673717 RepID=UPI000680F769|nr:hypothetical protein [Anaeromassilibacillus senegalensis]
MKLQSLRKNCHTITIDEKPMTLRMDLNALDYLERTCGGIEQAANAQDIKTQKHFIRAFLLCNYPENAEVFNRDDLNGLKPSLYQVGQWFDPDTIAAVSLELYTLALEQMEVPEGENSLGEQMKETVVAAIGALLKLCGQPNLDEALKVFGYRRQEKS